MTKDGDILKERVTAITLWGLPWVIVSLTFLFFHDHLHLESFVANGSIITLSVICLFYVVSSYCSFNGFVLPLFLKNKLNTYYKIEAPLYSEEYSGTAEKLLERYKGRIESQKLYAAVIVIRDFLLHYRDNKNVKEISSYIPSVGQIKAYPYESLCLMLSSQEMLKAIDADKYYNFELILNTCLSDGK